MPKKLSRKNGYYDGGPLDILLNNNTYKFSGKLNSEKITKKTHPRKIMHNKLSSLSKFIYELEETQMF
jgi:hypothetical protein